MGTCALRGGRSATNATNPGEVVESSTQLVAGGDTPGVEAAAVEDGRCQQVSVAQSVLYFLPLTDLKVEATVKQFLLSFT